MALGVQRKTLIALVSLNLIAQIPLGSNISSIWKPVFINNVILRCAFSRFLLTCTVVCLPATPQKVCQGRPAFKCQISRFSRWRKKEGNEQLCWDLLDSSLTFKAAFAGPSARAKFNHYSFSILSCYKLWAAFFFFRLVGWSAWYSQQFWGILENGSRLSVSFMFSRAQIGKIAIVMNCPHITINPVS